MHLYWVSVISFIYLFDRSDLVSVDYYSAYCGPPLLNILITRCGEQIHEYVGTSMRRKKTVHVHI